MRLPSDLYAGDDMPSVGVLLVPNRDPGWLSVRVSLVSLPISRRSPQPHLPGLIVWWEICQGMVNFLNSSDVYIAPLSDMITDGIP